MIDIKALTQEDIGRKVVYYDAYKDEKLLINNPSEILLGS